MSHTITRILWGNISKKELKESGLLSLAFCLIIGAYWMLRLIKDATFMHLVGAQHLPIAKIVAFTSLFVIVLFYNKLVNWFEKAKLVYIITTFYGITFLLFGALLHQVIASHNLFPLWLNQGLGWAVYIAIESLGSIVVVLFWSFVISNPDKSPASGHAVIIIGGQIGALLGTFLLTTQATNLGVPILSGIAATALLAVPFVIKLYTLKHGHAGTLTEKIPHKKTTSVIEGIKLICTKPYLIGIAVISTVYEIISYFFEYQMNASAHATLHSLNEVTSFLGMYGVTTNAVSLLLAIFGTSFFIRRFGLTTCLIFYPTCVAGLVLYTWAYPTIWSFLITVVGIKTLSYTLNEPCKEIMYIPTSTDIKFKAKSWVDVQGNKSAKATGAAIASLFSNVSTLLIYSSIISLGIIAIWIPVALFIGKANNRLVAENKIIE